MTTPKGWTSYGEANARAKNVEKGARDVKRIGPGEAKMRCPIDETNNQKPMKHLPKVILAVSATTFIVSLTAAGSNIHYGMLKPVSAILFIVFFILHVLQKEVVKFDQEHENNIAAARRKGPAKAGTPYGEGAKSLSRGVGGERAFAN